MSENAPSLQQHSDEIARLHRQLEEARAELHAVEERYRNAFEYTGTAMMVVEDDASISMWNHKLTEVTGYSEEDALQGRKWTEFVSPEELPRLSRYHTQRRIDPSSAPQEYEFKLRHKSGELRDILIHVSMVPGTKKSLISLIDITERKRALEQLQESERRFKEIAELLPGIICEFDKDFRLTYVNKKGLDTFGYTAEDVARGITLLEVLPADEQEHARHDMSNMFGGDWGNEQVYRLRKRDGSPMWMLVNSAPVLRDNRPAGMRTCIIDISDRVAAEQHLRESEARFKETVDLLPCVICEFDLQMNFTYVNQLSLSSFGYTADDVRAGFNALRVVHPEEHERVRKNVAAILRGEKLGPQEYRMVHRDGREAVYILNSSPIRKDGRIAGLRTSLFDISERKEMEVKLRESEERFRSIYSHSPIGIALFTPRGILVDANGSFREMFRAAEGATLFDLTGGGREGFEALSRGESVRCEAAFDPQALGAQGGRVEAAGSPRYLDWHVTPLGPDKLNPTVLLAQVEDVTDRRLAEQSRLREAREAAEQANRLVQNLRKDMVQAFSFNAMVSRSPQMREIFELLPQMAETSATVLVSGESGTGKELIARALHELSPRKSKPFVAINCGALPDNLLESELFGYKAGAFTDARKDKPGKFAQAEGGTVFLDEIGDISAAMQVKLLRVIQERVYEPLGSTRSEKADIRIVAATNKDLAAMVRAGTFREDLYYRINVLQVKLPALRDRRSDIPLLVDHFVGRFNARYNRSVSGITDEALACLLSHNFPGNIRELENVIERAFVFCRGDRIEPQHLPAELRGQQGEPAKVLAQVGSFDELERMYLQSVLEETGNNKAKAAQKLGIHKATLFRRMKRLNMQ